jgi:hypothetical protein
VPSPIRPARRQHHRRQRTSLLTVARGGHRPRRSGRPKAPSPGGRPISGPRIPTGLEMTARPVPTVRSAMTRSAAMAQLMSTPRTTLTAGTVRSARRPRTRASLLSRPRARRPRRVQLVPQDRPAGPARLARPPTRARRARLARRVSPVSRTSPVRRPRWIRLVPVRRAHRAPVARRPRLGRVRPVLRVRQARLLQAGWAGRPPQVGQARPAGPDRLAGRVLGPRRAGRQRRVRQAGAGRQRAVRQGQPRRQLLRVQAGRVSRARLRRRAREKTRPRIVTGVRGRRPPTAMPRPTGGG